MNALKIALVGIGGFAYNHLENLRRLQDMGRVELVAVCDINYEKLRGGLAQYGYTDVPGYADFDQMLAQVKAQAIDIVAPIPFHAQMAGKAMDAGFDVLVEKPPAVTIQEYDALMSVQKRTGRQCIINFQMTSEPGFRALLDRLSAGMIGQLRSVRAVGMWKRDIAYFTRSSWVGRLRFNGMDTLDGILMNPFAHLWNNSLLLGFSQGGGIESVLAELYHANAVEGDDLTCVRVRTGLGCDIVFAAATCCPQGGETCIEIIGTAGQAKWSYGGDYVIQDPEGRVMAQDHPRCDAHRVHYENVVNALSGQPVAMLSHLEDTRNFVLATNLAFCSSGQVHRIGAQYLRHLDPGGQPAQDPNAASTFVCVEDVEQAIRQVQKTGKLFSQLSQPWAVSGTPLEAEGFGFMDVGALYPATRTD